MKILLQNSLESEVVQVMNDIYVSTDKHFFFVHVLLELLAAFDYSVLQSSLGFQKEYQVLLRLEPWLSCI